MEFILTGTRSEVVSLKDSGKDNYVMTVQCWPRSTPSDNGSFYRITIAKEQFKRLAKAS